MSTHRWPRATLAVVLLVLTAMTVACSKHKNDASLKPKAENFSPVPVHSVTYMCSNKAQIVAQLATARMQLRLSPDLVLSLKREHADAGLRYAYASNVFLINGRQATLILPGNRPLSCQQQSSGMQ